MSWEDSGLLALWVATVAQVVFVVVYASARKFWRHFVGRALFTKSAALALVLGATLFGWYVTPYPYQLQVGVILMWTVAGAIVYQLLALVRQRRIDQGKPGLLELVRQRAADRRGRRERRRLDPLR